jgi:hypothetical protein
LRAVNDKYGATLPSNHAGCEELTAAEELNAAKEKARHLPGSFLANHFQSDYLASFAI